MDIGAIISLLHKQISMIQQREQNDNAGEGTIIEAMSLRRAERFGVSGQMEGLTLSRGMDNSPIVSKATKLFSC